MTITDSLSIIFSLPAIIAFFTSIVVTISLFSFIFKKERRLFKNLQKPIMLISLSSNTQNNLEIEHEQLEKGEFFKNIEKPSLSTKKPQTINNHSLVILGVDKTTSTEVFQKVFKEIGKKTPIIIYTFGENRVLQDKDWETLKDHLWYSVCNTPLRLNADVFSILSTYTYDC